MFQMRVCKESDISDTPPQEEKKKAAKARSVRHEIAALWSIIDIATGLILSKSKLSDLRCYCEYGMAYSHTGRKRRSPVDVQKMIGKWNEWIVTFSTSHDKVDVDEAEYNIDSILTPLLSAPVNQLREFYSGLCDALEKDKRVPFFIWKFFAAWKKIVIDKATDDGKIIRLKKRLAGEIAEMVEKDQDARKDIFGALQGALMWRDPESLKEIKEDIKAGAKPRIKGRQSCLFLTAKRRGRNQKEHAVML